MRADSPALPLVPRLSTTGLALVALFASGCDVAGPLGSGADVLVTLRNDLDFEISVTEQVFYDPGTIHTDRGVVAPGAEITFYVPAYLRGLDVSLVADVAAAGDVDGGAASTGVWHDVTVQRAGGFSFDLDEAIREASGPIHITVDTREQLFALRLSSAVADTISLSMVGDGIDFCMGYQWGINEEGHRWSYQHRALFSAIRVHAGVGCSGAYHEWILASLPVAPGSGVVEIGLDALPEGP